MINRLLAIERSHPNIAYLYAVIGNLAQVGMQINFKIVSAIIPPFYVLMMRAFTLLMLNLYITKANKIDVYIRDPHCTCLSYVVWRMVLKRLMFSTTFAMILHYSLKYLPASAVNSLSNTSPIFIFFI